MDYTPDLVDHWLRNWPLLESLSETPASSAHLLSPECRGADKACSNGRPVGIKDVRQHGDPMRYVDIKADLSHAAYHLHPSSLERRVVAERIATGGKLRSIAKLCGARYDDVLKAYQAGCKLMAEDLGWVEVDGNPDQC